MEKTDNIWIRLEITTPPEFVEPIGSFLEDIGVSGSYQELGVVGEANEWGEDNDILTAQPLASEQATERLIAHIPKDVNSEKISAALNNYLNELRELFPTTASFHIASQVIENPDWNEAWKKYFKPLRIGKNIVVKPSWEHWETSANEISIEIDPGMAFGTGQHASTRLCLEAMEALLTSVPKKLWRMLDWGTGTGILAIYGAKAGINEIVAIDTDDNAIAIARENAAINTVAEHIAFRVRDTANQQESFSLIVANLTAKLLISNRHNILSALDGDGHLIISGILAANGDEIERNFAISPNSIYRKSVNDGWLCYTIQKR